MAAGAATEMLGGIAAAGRSTPSRSRSRERSASSATRSADWSSCRACFRNATGAAIALAAIEMALAGITFAIPADEVIDTMGEIGREMDVRYRETAGGGLAATPTGRRLARERLVQIKRG